MNTFLSPQTASTVAIELKRAKFKPEYAGKMNFYLNLLDDFVKEPHENPSIGILGQLTGGQVHDAKK